MNSFICPNKKLIISLHSKRFHLVSEQRKTGFGRARNEMRAKNWNRGEGKEGNACRQSLRFWKPAFASERNDWLARIVEQYCHVSIKGLFSYWEVIYGTWHTRCDCCLVWSARFTLLFWNAKLFLRLHKAIRSFNLFSKVPLGSE